jgi:hypothetical protein
VLSQFGINGAEQGVPKDECGLSMPWKDGGFAQSVLDLELEAFSLEE